MAKRQPLRKLYPERKIRKKGFSLIAGVDESGRGPLAGPVVASAVIIRDINFNCEINDSKLLSPKKRRLAYHEILNKAFVGIGIVSHEIIDLVNIREATIMAMEEAVLNLNVTPEFLLIDGMLNLNLPYPQECIIKGDTKSLSIAAASIIAKNVRDSLMFNYHKIYPEYRFDLHKGYGTLFHKKMIKKYGLSPIHRKTFKIR